MAEQRKLAAILVADVVGFSRLTASNEHRTLARMRTLRSDVIDPTVAIHRGRIVKSTGDGVLCEFPSTVEAVRCALELQTEMTDRNSGTPSDRRIVLRIGVHVGDVFQEVDGDLMGDGVNIAARLEGIADPGAICLSEDAYRQIRGKIDLTARDLGEKALKNIAIPIRVYAVAINQTAREEPSIFSGSVHTELSLPSKASIAVLPFVNMSGDSEHEFFTDGLTEDIITDLSNVPGFFVIARNSTFVYKGKPTDVRRIGRDLGVRYVLEGSARRSEKRLRVNVQLIDAEEGGRHVWAERYDREISDIFELQDEVTRRVVEAISGKIGPRDVVARPRPTNLEAYDLCVRSRHKFQVSSSYNNEAVAALERALEIDPCYCEAHSNLAVSLLYRWMIWGEPQVPNRARALTHARRAVEIDPNDSRACDVLGYVQIYERKFDEARLLLETAICLNPNNADAFANMAELLVFMGKPHDALNACSTALRLNPHPHDWYFWIMGFAQIAARQFREAVSTLCREETYGTGSREHLIAALSLSGRLVEAQEEARLMLTSNPAWRIGQRIANLPFRSSDTAQLFADGWRLAGMPE